MKKILFTTAIVSAFAAFPASAQNYNPYYSEQAIQESYAPNNYYNYGQPQRARKDLSFKRFSVGFDYVLGEPSLTKNEFVMESPLTGGAEYTGSSDMFEDSVDSINVSLGWRPFKYLGFEAFYQQSLSDNEVKYRESYSLDDRFAQAEYNLKYAAYGIDALLYIPIFSRMDILGTVGVAQYDMTAEVELSGYSGDTSNPLEKNKVSFDEDKIAFRYGAGAQIWLSQRLAFRAMYRYTSISSDYLDDITEVSLGLRYNF